MDRALAKAEKAVREEAFAPPPRDAGAEATGILRFNGWRCNASNQTVAAVATAATSIATITAAAVTITMAIDCGS